jgi:hypothetical protein
MKYKILFTIYLLFQFSAIYSQKNLPHLDMMKVELRDNIEAPEITTEIIFTMQIILRSIRNYQT